MTHTPQHAPINDSKNDLKNASDADSLAAALEGFSLNEEKQKNAPHPEEERVRVGFEDIITFYEEKGHLPLNEATRPIGERLQAVRLEILRKAEHWRTLLEKENADIYGLLQADGHQKPPPPKKLPPFGNDSEKQHAYQDAYQNVGQEYSKGYVKGQGSLCF